MTDYRLMYDDMVEEYTRTVSDQFAQEELQKYNEVLFSCHSCGIEGN